MKNRRYVLQEKRVNTRRKNNKKRNETRYVYPAFFKKNRCHTLLYDNGVLIILNRARIPRFAKFFARR